MSSAATRMIITADGGVVFPGIDYEGRKVTVHHRRGQLSGAAIGDVVVLHITGGSGWGGVGSRSYAPAQFEVVRLKAKGRKDARYLGHVGQEWHYDHVVEFEIKKQRQPEAAAGRRRR